MCIDGNVGFFGQYFNEVPTLWWDCRSGRGWADAAEETNIAGHWLMLYWAAIPEASACKNQMLDISLSGFYFASTYENQLGWLPREETKQAHQEVCGDLS